MALPKGIRAERYCPCRLTRLSVQNYAGHAMQTYTEVQGLPQVGDGARAFVLKSSGSVDYVLYFSSGNFQHVVEILGIDSEATPDFALSLARTLLQKLKSPTPSSTTG